MKLDKQFLITLVFSASISLGIYWCMLHLVDEKPPTPKGWVKIGEEVDDNYKQ